MLRNGKSENIVTTCVFVWLWLYPYIITDIVELFSKPTFWSKNQASDGRPVNLSEIFVGNSLQMCVLFGDSFEKSSDSAIIGEML